MRLKERFDFILSYKRIDVYDSIHCLDEFKRHYPHLPLTAFKRVVKDGIDCIYYDYNLKPDNYMIVSYSLGLRIPFELRQDRFSGRLMGVIPTTLASYEVKNKLKNVNILVEKNRLHYHREPLCEGFNYYYQSGETFFNFTSIYLD